MPAPDPAADRNMLFGILALQLDFVGRDGLVAAMNAWLIDKAKPLGDILRDQGHLSAGRLELLSALVAEHLGQHGGDPRQSLAAIAPLDAPDRAALTAAGAADLTDSIYAVGSAHVARPRTIDFVRPAGRYEILRPHAKGGLGEVFVAEDTELHREVALKEIQPHFADDPDRRARFVLEAEITGGLEHPGVVPVYGLGSYPDGRPYYAMRFVRGDDLQQAIRRFHGVPSGGRQPPETSESQGADAPRSADFASLAFRQLLRRFIDVCNAIAYAHSRGVLHRDLKPGNVMLGKYGETLVVDWGLAKVVGRESTQPSGLSTDEPTLAPRSGGDSSATVAGRAFGTPAYMSPEQAAGQVDILGPATDVYGLGASLYELLTGRVAFEGKSLDDVQKGLFPRPRQACPTVPRPLEAACLKAMALAPVERYATPLDLSAEIERWLADEPIAAYREPLAGRARRWLKRRRTLVTGLAAVLLTAVAGLSVGSWLLWREQKRTEAEKLVAERNADAALKLTDRLLDTANRQLTAPAFASVARALVPVRRIITDDALEAVRPMLAQQPDDPEMRERAALILRHAANVRRSVNELDDAEAKYREAIALLEGLTAGNPGSAHYAARLADARRDYSQLLVRRGNLGAACKQLGLAAEAARAAAVREPAVSGHRRTEGLALLDRSGAEYARADYAESERCARTAARQLASIPVGESQSTDALFLAASLNRIAAAQRELDHIDDALTTHDRTLKQCEVVLASKTNDAHHFVARARLEQGITLTKRKARWGDAQDALTKAIDAWTDLRGRLPDYPHFAEWQAAAYRARGELHAAAGRPVPAAADLNESRTILEALTAKPPALPGPLGSLGRTYAALGRLAAAAGEPAAADWFAKARQALTTAVQLAPEDGNDKAALKALPPG